ncbi:hypothetical protein B0H67DRAFT_234178 [Lasiosphaeris hirsuta]|uniref:Uncharacterized protein n=1 Tax=Lasiosphaeris hirsuta TaxID=260670 RepID=A0AA40AFX1_9PEZI|nr:hypothetical protein B0H67DRAFT_234178 [Lasiosphaeris hirsuta]
MESHDNYYAFLAGLESHDDWRVDSVDDTLSSSNENLGSFFLEDTQPEYVPCSANPPQALSGTNGSDVPDFPEHSFSSAPPAAAEYLAAEQLDDMCMWGNLEMGLNEDTLQGLSQPVPDAEVITPTTSIDTTWTPPWSDPASASPLAASDTTTQLSPAVSLPHPMTPATPSPHFQFHFDQATFHESSGGDGLMHQAADFQQPSEPELRPQSQAQSDIHMPNTAPPRTPM